MINVLIVFIFAVVFVAIISLWKTKFNILMFINIHIFSIHISNIHRSNIHIRVLNISVISLLLLFSPIFTTNSNLSNATEINTDFSSIFNKASTEEGKRDIVPTYQGTNIPETQVNNNNMDSRANEALQNNEAGNFINDSFSTRPSYDTKQLGNIIDGSERITDNSERIVNKNYCDPNNNIEYKICYKHYGNNACSNNLYNRQCKSNLEMKCIKYMSGCSTAGVELSSLPSDLDWSYNGSNGILIIGKRSGSNYWNGTCLVVDRTIEFTVSNLELVEYFALNRLVFDDYMSVTLNNNLIYVGPDNGTQLIVSGNKVNDGKGTKSCERATLWNQYIAKDITPFLKTGKNTLQMRVIVSGSGQGSMELLLKNRCCEDHAEKWTETCDTIATIEDNQYNSQYDKCNITSKLCTKKDYTVIFEGKPIPKKCAEYDISYSCIQNNNCYLHDNDCDNYDIANCLLESREFIENTKETEKFTYKCLTPKETPDNSCNQKIQCLDGNCQDIEPVQDNSQAMLETIAILSTLNESAKTINPEDLTMLNGDNLKCKKSTGAVGAFLDCCGDGNWGNDLGINCNSEEDKLQMKRQNNDCISIGSYCSEEINIGIDKVCITKKYSYCCYNNKFSKIIGNATRQQSLQTWGSAEHTNCNGIPIEQLSLIDFNKVDFSELYNDINSNINQKDIEDKVKQSIGRLTNDY